MLLFTLLEKLLCLLSGLDSEPSKLRTLRIVLDLATAGLSVAGLRLFMLLMEPVETGVKVFSLSDEGPCGSVKSVVSVAAADGK